MCKAINECECEETKIVGQCWQFNEDEGRERDRERMERSGKRRMKSVATFLENEFQMAKNLTDSMNEVLERHREPREIKGQ
jgi:hypothetical protein